MNLKGALSHPLWKSHERNKSIYTMDDKPDRWVLVYYPIFSNYDLSVIYSENIEL